MSLAMHQDSNVLRSTLPEPEQVVEFMRFLGRPGSYGHIWTKKPEGSSSTQWYRPEELTTDLIESLSPKRHNYFGVLTAAAQGNERQRTKLGEARAPRFARALFSEFDYDHAGNERYAQAGITDNLSMYRHVLRLPLAPSAIVFSGGGVHCYWFLTEYLDLLEYGLGRFSGLLANWVDFTLGDPAAKDLARVLRIPGTVNCKPERGHPVVEFYKFDPSIVYTIKQLELCLSQNHTQPKTTKKAKPNGEIEPPIELQIQAGLATAKRMIREAQDGEKHTKLLAAARLAGGLVSPEQAEAALKPEIEAKKSIKSRKQAYKTLRDGIEYGQAAPIAAEKKYRMTDLGNARRLVDFAGSDLRYVAQWGKWYCWDGSRWEPDDTGRIERIAKAVPARIYQEALEADEDTRPALMKWGAATESAMRIASMIRLARSEPEVAIKHTWFDSDPLLLNCLNGTIDLTTGELQEHHRADTITKIIPVRYDPEADCPRWLAFLDKVMGGDEALIRFVKMATGYSLTGDITEKCLFFMYGTGDNGKTVLSEVLKRLLGDYGQKAPTDMIMRRRHESVPNDIARLVGARFAIVAEIEEGQRLAESVVKDLTGGDTIVARFMRQEFFEFSPTHKLWLYGNHKPIVTGTDHAIWNRIRLIPFKVTIPKHEQDPYLLQALIEELPGILNWAIEGCLDWQEWGLQAPPAVEQATSAYRADMDVLTDFLGDRCLIQKAAKVTAGDLHKAYTEWCNRSGEPTLGRRKFGERLQERGFYKEQEGNRYYWFGLGLLDE